MKIAIIGAGGVGGYIGAKLIQSGADAVTFVARGKHLEAIRQHGLSVEDEGEHFVVHPAHTVESLEGLGVYDLVILAVKSYDLEGALEMISAHINAQTVLLPLLNGVDHDMEIMARFPKSDVLNGCIYIFSNIKIAGHIRKYGGVFHLFYGSRSRPKTAYSRIEALFEAAGLSHRLTDKITLETWRKYLLISAFATMSSYYSVPLGVIARDHYDELGALLLEITAVAHAKGIMLTEKNRESVLDRITRVPFDSKTSMQLDFEAGKPTELEALSGYIVREGRAHGIETPVMQRMYRHLAER